VRNQAIQEECRENCSVSDILLAPLDPWW